MPGVTDTVVSMTRTETKLAVPETGVNETEAPEGTPVADRPTALRDPLSRITETVV